MPQRQIGQESFFRVERVESCLDKIDRLLDWSDVEHQLHGIHASPRGEAAWPPLALFKALLISVWYDLSDVRLAEALDDRASFRRFCGFSSMEATPERTAFVRFRKALLAQDLEGSLFASITAQLTSKAIEVKTGTIVDATIVPSHSKTDREGKWVKHKGKPSVHGYKAHVGADAQTALVEEIVVTTANVNDGKAGPGALPPNPGDVFADSAYRGPAFEEAVKAKGGQPRIVQTGVWAKADPVSQAEAETRLKAHNQDIHKVRGRIEKIFGTWKRSCGLARMRWCDIAKARLQILLTAIACNLKRTHTILQSI